MIFFCLALLCAIVKANPADLITHLPGQPKSSFNMYAGYVDVSTGPKGRALFYWFVEHVSTPATAPVTVWLQGGPGCSSLLGFFTENGPYKVNPDGATLSHNPESWNRQSNMLFIESPAGVGFSYDLSSPNPSTGDNQTRFDTYEFLRGWYAKFPQYQSNPLYISGESYGGHYVPQLSWTILEQNKVNAFKMPLAGMLVGNPWTDDVLDGGSIIPWIFNHALASKRSYDAVMRECSTLKFSKRSHARMNVTSMLASLVPADPAFATPKCDAAQQQFMSEVGDDINQYDIYTECVHGGSFECMDYSALEKYLNSRAVQVAVHARSSQLLYPWAPCAGHLNYDSAWPSVVQLYPILMKELDHVMVYSGDVTWNCNTLGSQLWIESLNLHETSQWAPWKVNGQVGGYHTGYSLAANMKRSFSFVTVRDAGHMTPQFQPLRSFIMFDNFLNGRF